MPVLTLRELQTYFKKALDDPADDNLHKCIQENNLGIKSRLQIYRNNIYITLTETLRSVYPVIQQLVGDEFFNAVAQAYIIHYPSSVSDLYMYGDKFAEFIADFLPAQTLPYLSEVANLEWACHRALRGEIYLAFDINKLKMIPETDYSGIHFQLPPTSQVFAFHYPVLAIWKLCQTRCENQEPIDLAMGGEKILVIRRQWDVVFESLGAGEYALLSACKKELSLEEACTLALVAEPEFNINFCLQDHLLRGTIIGIG